MKHCFTKEQIGDCLAYLLDKSEVDENIVLMIEEAKQWSSKIILINYLTTQIIQRGLNKSNLPNNFIQKLYSIEDMGDLVIDEIDRDFIEFIFNHLSVSSDMSSNLIHYKQKQINYDYGEQVRY